MKSISCYYACSEKYIRWVFFQGFFAWDNGTNGLRLLRGTQRLDARHAMEVDSSDAYTVFIVGESKLAALSRALAERSPVLAAVAAQAAPVTLPDCFAPPALASLLAFVHTGRYAPPSPESPANAAFATAGPDSLPSFALPPPGSISASLSQRNKALGFSLPQLASTVASPASLVELYALCAVYGVEDLKPTVAKDIVAVLSPATAADMLRKARECARVLPAESGFSLITETIERFVRTKMATDPDTLLNPPAEGGHLNGAGGPPKREIKEIRRKRVKE